MGWFSFLINECIKPYQAALTGVPFAVRGLNFLGQAPRYGKNESVERYLDGNLDVYRDRVSQLAVHINRLTNGLVSHRLERCFSHIFIDELQDCAGYDLEVLDMLLATSLNVVLMGDPRQTIITTNHGNLNRKYRGKGLWKWVEERSGHLVKEERIVNHRCCAEICAVADSIFPDLPPSTSGQTRATTHDGVFFVRESDLDWYLRTYNPDVVLRYSKAINTFGLPATNIGVAKGDTFDRVVVFPTKPMNEFLRNRDHRGFNTPEHLYVALTRARFSVAFILPENDCSVYTTAGPGSLALPPGAL
jgi:DNA helicase-2/ATP-dependent DNA helicase PcrA